MAQRRNENALLSQIAQGTPKQDDKKGDGSNTSSTPSTGSTPSGVGMARGGKIKRVLGPKIGKDDGLIPAKKGEFVVRKEAVKKVGLNALNQINKGRIPAAKPARKGK